MDLESVKRSFYKDVERANTGDDIEKIRIAYLGREKGHITLILRSIKDLSLEEKRVMGPLANELRQEIESILRIRQGEFHSLSREATTIDITMPGEKASLGHIHPLTQVENDIQGIFKSLNFAFIDGPEIEKEHYNFDALNIPLHHPARDMWDTFWLKTKSANRNERLLLRTHTSPVQIRYMETHKPPFQIISPGRVFRFEAIDATHEINFHQVEGLMMGKSVSVANFKYVIGLFLKQFFGKEVEVRFRPSYFPFVEPGLEIDIKIKNKWLEVMGAGMVHRKVLEGVNYDPEIWQGFAFGLGLERFAMIKYNIHDVRLFYSGDMRFIHQFN